MFNLLKSDVYRLVHGKMFWVAAIVLVALSALAAGMMHWVSSPEFLRMTATSFEMTVNVSDGAPGGAGVLGEEECRHQRDDHGQRPSRHRHISQHIGRRGQGAHVAGHSFEIGVAERLGIVGDEIPQLARGECGIACRLIVAHAVLFGFGRPGGLGSA